MGIAEQYSNAENSDIKEPFWLIYLKYIDLGLEVAALKGGLNSIIIIGNTR